MNITQCQLYDIINTDNGGCIDFYIIRSDMYNKVKKQLGSHNSDIENSFRLLVENKIRMFGTSLANAGR